MVDPIKELQIQAAEEVFLEVLGGNAQGAYIQASDGPGNINFSLQVEFGNRLLFAPELGVGYQVNDRLSFEASLVHLSHGQLFGNQNPGIDNLGVRVNWKF